MHPPTAAAGAVAVALMHPSTAAAGAVAVMHPSTAAAAAAGGWHAEARPKEENAVVRRPRACSTASVDTPNTSRAVTKLEVGRVGRDDSHATRPVFSPAGERDEIEDLSGIGDVGAPLDGDGAIHALEPSLLRWR